MYILSVCSSPEVLKVIMIVKTVITIIRIVVPILLLISVSLNYLNAIRNNDSDALEKANKMTIIKVIAAILVFFIPTFVNIIGNITGEKSYLSCFDVATKEGISAAYEENARQYINKAKTTYSQSDYEFAKNYISNIDDQIKQQELLQELEIVKTVIDIKTEINNLSKNYDYQKYLELEKKINSLSDETIKKDLAKQLEKVYGGQPLNIASSFNKYNDTKYSPLIGYYLYIPKNATTNMPLIVMMPPNSSAAPSMVSAANTLSLENLRAFIYIPIEAGGSSIQQWNMSASNASVKKIKDLIKEYQLDENRISLTAFSSSGWYIYQTANNHRIFAAIAPVSSGMGITSIKNYNDWEYLKTLPMKGYGEKGGATTETGRSCAGKTVGWSAKTAMCSTFEGLGKCNNCLSCEYFTYMKDSCHGEMGNHVFKIDENNNGISDIFEWMISQRK